jgi:hypothetical protein
MLFLISLAVRARWLGARSADLGRPLEGMQRLSVDVVEGGLVRGHGFGKP